VKKAKILGKGAEPQLKKRGANQVCLFGDVIRSGAGLVVSLANQLHYLACAFGFRPPGGQAPGLHATFTFSDEEPACHGA
jgi:hypothetical protein